MDRQHRQQLSKREDRHLFIDFNQIALNHFVQSIRDTTESSKLPVSNIIDSRIQSLTATMN